MYLSAGFPMKYFKRSVPKYRFLEINYLFLSSWAQFYYTELVPLTSSLNLKSKYWSTSYIVIVYSAIY